MIPRFPKAITLAAAVVILLSLQSCNNAGPASAKEVVDSVEYPTVRISADGLLSYKGMPLSEDDLAALVKKEVEQRYLARNPTHDYGIVIIDADDRVSHGRVREVNGIIVSCGGRPGTRTK